MTRRFSIPAFLMAILLAGAVSFSCAMCLGQSFSMPYAPNTLLISCIGFSVLSSSFLSLRRNWMITVLAAVIYGGMLWFFRHALLSGLSSAVYCVTRVYATAYDSVAVLGVSGGDCTAVLTILALPLAWITAWTVNREGSAVLVALICAPVLVLCLTIVDLTPVPWLVILTGALVLLLLTNGVRARDIHQGGQLAWLLLPPAAAVMTALILLSPPENYTRADWITRLQTYSEQVVGLDREDRYSAILPGHETVRWSRSLRNVDLATVGPRIQTHTKVLDYTADTPISYLRGVSLGIYENNSWSAIAQDVFLAEELDGEGLMTAAAMTSGEVRIQTLRPGEHLYTPYGMTSLPRSGQAVDDAYVSNTGKTTVYSIPYATGSVTSPDLIGTQYENYVNQNYTAVPEELRQALTELLAAEGLTPPVNAMEAAAAVSAYLKQTAVYDLNTAPVPAQEDFVLYFLTQSKQGYCVHFATAAAVLLRTMGIPTRYVTGYSVSGPEGQINTVTTDDAHAWVEYYVSGLGWVILDPTPPDLHANDEPDNNGEPAAPDQNDIPETSADNDTQPAPEQLPQTGSASGNGASNSENASLWLWLLCGPALLVLVCLRRLIVLFCRGRQYRTARPNRRCLLLWRQLARVSKAAGIPPEEELIVLAEKARFSQHTMTKEECAQLAQALAEHTRSLKESASPLKRLWYRYGVVIY